MEDTPRHDGQPDANPEFPVYGTGPTGGKITVTGTAQITFPAHMALPPRDDFTFNGARRVTIPQTNGAFPASMWPVITAR